MENIPHWLTSEDVSLDLLKYLILIYLQHSRCCWIGGHFSEPNEQNTQQSPELGRNNVLQLVHS